MPLALLLHEATAAFRFGARSLGPWNHLVQVEEMLIDRARSAFLFKWFGLGLPLHGFHVRVAIANIAELRKRYAEVKAQVRQRAEGPNLTEPIFGMAGVAAGMILTPGVALGSTLAVVRSLDWNMKWYWVILQGLVSGIAILVSPFVGAAVVGLSPLLAAGSLAGYTYMAVMNYPGLRSIYDLLGGLAELLRSATRFINLLLGPRSEVRNPVLRGMLHLLDQFAKLFPFALALVAVIVTRFGPLLVPLAMVVGAFIDLVGELVGAIKFVLDDFVERLKAVFSGPENIVSPLKRIFGVLKLAFSKILPAFNELMDASTTTLEDWFEGVTESFDEWNRSFAEVLEPSWLAEKTKPLINSFRSYLKGLRKTPVIGSLSRALDFVLFKGGSFFGALGENLKKLFKRDPNYVRLDNVIEALKLAGGMLMRDSTKKKEEEEKKASVFDPFVEHAKKWAKEAEEAGKTFPDLPEFETPGKMQDRLKLEAKHGIPPEKKGAKGEGRYDELLKKAGEALTPVSEAVTKYVERARHPTSAFAYEQKALAAESGAATPSEALSKARAEVTRLRGELEAVVGRVLPPEMRHLLVAIGETAELMDETVTLDKKKAKPKPKKPAKKEPPKLNFPVKDVPKDNGLLRPVVQRLRLHSKSGEREGLRDFLELLQEKLDRRYPAPT
ncbi:MAG TPA: hypothetical protein VF591_25895 [Pyrinomonadaceae bacterium]|jgi:hypothetical protein